MGEAMRSIMRIIFRRFCVQIWNHPRRRAGFREEASSTPD
jgi:hypothetical protein